MGCAKCLFLIFIIQVVLRSTNAAIGKTDVSDCIERTKESLKEQQDSTKQQIFQIKKQKTADITEHKNKKNTNLNTYIEKEKSIIASFKQSAIQDNYNVSACNDSSSVFDAIQKSFATNTTTILEEYQSVSDRNYTQTLFVINQLAMSYQQLQKKLDDCADIADCFEKLQDECEFMRTDDDISELESKFLSGAEQISSNYRSKMDVLYQSQTKEVLNYSKELKDCYKKNLNKDDNGDKKDANDEGYTVGPLSFLVIVAVAYTLLL